ncbi:ABC transporter ATP-binding protein [Granulicella arctica]|uniref:ABC transporter ATP-binding protein n=1 Tax=Granulicella arctica TaxID=940613 RepID=UPI0021E00AD9|nr:ATP-binding cassette domain-containing protein [Granulicella arctica]
MSDHPVVEFKQVSKRFGDRKVLENVSFTVNEGEVLCVLGRSGTGKSVTLKLIIGLLKPDSGSVFIGDEDISQLERDGLSKVRRGIGFLFQSAALFDSFTVGDNLALPVQRFDKKHKSPQQIQAEVKDMLRQVGLEKDMDKLPGELSGGMKKRAGLARALVLNPKLLLVDEPSSGLDRITASEIDHLLMKFNKERNTTMIIVTHDVRGARRLADKVAVLDQGSLVGFGTIEELDRSDNDLVRELISESQS